ncbi:RHS repeat-associated core domain-containing protein [Thermodesulfovibrionales bacterium]|nr:RHS repeat-associated core domain-containing protein [Thermodesulfovibrionales bacterium]
MRVKFLNDINLPLVQVVMEIRIEEEEKVFTYYTIGNDLISMRRDDDTYFYHYDALGSVRQLTDDEGDTEEEYVYCAFGTPLEDNNDNPYGFTGERQFDEADGLVFLRARYYDPSIGRFISRDPWTWGPDDPRILMTSGHPANPIIKRIVLTIGATNPQFQHPYVYALNNPVNLIDPSGLFFYGLPDYMIGAGLVGLGIKVVTGPVGWAAIVVGVVIMVTSPISEFTMKRPLERRVEEVAEQLQRRTETIEEILRKLDRTTRGKP